MGDEKPTSEWSELAAAAVRSIAEGHAGRAITDGEWEASGLQGIADKLARDLEAHIPSPEQRWHEIATEGLPPEDAIGADFWIFGVTFSPRPMLAQFDGQDVSSPWDPYEELQGRLDDGKITHWQRAIVPAPPTKEPR